jgi:hypothetical protein
MTTDYTTLQYYLTIYGADNPRYLNYLTQYDAEHSDYRYTTLVSDVTSLFTGLSTANTNITTLQSNITTIQTNIAQLISDVTSLFAIIANHESRLTGHGI